jgi:hypothetical protein
LDEGSLGLDTVLDEFFADEAEAPPEEQASPEDDTVSAEDADVQPDVAVADALPPTDEVAPPAPDITAQIAAMEARLASVQAKADEFDQLKRMASQRQAELQEQAFYERMEKRQQEAEDLPPAQAAAERNRIAREIKQYVEQSTQPAIAESQEIGVEAARGFAGLYHAIQARYGADSDEFKELIADAKAYSKAESPEAIQAHVARDNALIAKGEARALARMKAAQDAAKAKQAQARIASGVDAVNAVPGAPARSSGNSIDDAINSLFG